MKKKIIRITENDLHGIIRKTVNEIISERILGQGENFTPYKEGEGKKMFDASQKRTPEERNPWYAKALKAKQEKK